jgi:hypothetical protein
MTNCIIPTMDRLYVEYRYAPHFHRLDAGVDIQLTFDKSQYDNLQAVFSTICDDIGLNDKYFKIESGRAASAMIT